MDRNNATAPKSDDEAGHRTRLAADIHAQPEMPALPRVLTVSEAAAYLRVNRKTLYELIQRDGLPGVRRVGRTLRISSAALVSWLGEGRVPR